MAKRLERTTSKSSWYYVEKPNGTFMKVCGKSNAECLQRALDDSLKLNTTNQMEAPSEALTEALNVEIRELTLELDQKVKEVEDLQAKLEAKPSNQGDTETLRSVITELNLQCGEKDETIKRLTEENSTLTLEVATLKDDLEGKDIEIGVLGEKLERVEKDLEETKANGERLAGELYDEQNKVETYQEEEEEYYNPEEECKDIAEATGLTWCDRWEALVDDPEMPVLAVTPQGDETYAVEVGDVSMLVYSASEAISQVKIAQEDLLRS